jgi:hypothetical protein
MLRAHFCDRNAAKDVIVGYLLKVGKARLPTPASEAEQSVEASAVITASSAAGKGQAAPAVSTVDVSSIKGKT